MHIDHCFFVLQRFRTRLLLGLLLGLFLTRFRVKNEGGRSFHKVQVLTVCFVLSEFVTRECSIGLWEAYVYQVFGLLRVQLV